MRLTFNRAYFILAFVLLIVEVLIALYVRDAFIRPYVGDYLVVIMVYCALMAFIDASPMKLALIALLFAYFIEALQYFNFLNTIGLAHNEFAKTLIGYGFAWLDLLAYTLGIMTVLLVERWRKLHLLNES